MCRWLRGLLLLAVLAACWLPPALADDYDRRAFPHWRAGQVVGDGLNACEEVMVARSLVPAVVEDGKVISGVWVDGWTGQFLWSPRIIDCDHLVTLLEAYRSGAMWLLDRDGRLALANDPDNIVLTHRSLNRSRGGADFHLFVPPEPERMTWYAHVWILVKERYGLLMDVEEARALAPWLEPMCILPGIRRSNHTRTGAPP